MLTAHPKINPGRRGLPAEVKAAIVGDYLRTKSIQKVAQIWNRSEQAIWELLKTAGVQFYRKNNPRTIRYNGRSFTPGKGGYYRDTKSRKSAAGIEVQLQRQVWTDHRGAIPQGFTIGFLDGDKSNCVIENLICLSRSDLMRQKAKGENGYTKARQARRIQEHIGFVVKKAKQFSDRSGVDVDDLIEEGKLAIIRADQRYVQKDGASFLTYAAFWIRSYMQQYVAKNCSDVRAPESKFVSTVSLNAPIGDDDGRTVADLLGEDEAVTDSADLAGRYESVLAVLNELTDRERHLIRAYYLEGKTFKIIGAEFDLSPSGAQVAVGRALRKLRSKVCPLLKEAA